MEPNPKKVAKIKSERTLVLIKPDGVTRHLIGEIISRFERKGMKIVGMKMVWPDQKLAAKHYNDDDNQFLGTGTRTYEGYVSRGLKPPMSPHALGQFVRSKLMDGITAGPVVALVLQGAHVIELVRKMRGVTNPLFADVGTIGFDYTLDSYEIADPGNWAIRNIVHASDSPKTAKFEINLWFKPTELYDHETAIERVIYTKDWHQNRGRKA